jgi:hypothetical protein
VCAFVSSLINTTPSEVSHGVASNLESSKPGFTKACPAVVVHAAGPEDVVEVADASVDVEDATVEVTGSSVAEEVGLEVGDGDAVVPRMQEQAELTLPTSFLQFLKAVGMAAASVVVAARNSGQKDCAVPMKRLSMRFR